MRFMGTAVGGLMALILMGLFIYPVMAREYPTKPITLIIPHPAGGSTDLTSRSLTHIAKKYLGQPIIIENKGGGGGIVGPTMVVNKPPDGYTIGVMAISSIIGWHTGKTTYNPINDFTHIITYSGYVNGFAVRSDSKWTTIQELIDYSKQNPETISCATPGVGSSSHLVMEELAIAANVKWTHVPHKGDAGVTPALLGGHVEAGIFTSGGWGPIVEAGRFRLLATFGDHRIDKFKDVPTVKEIGYDVVSLAPLIIIGPKGMSKSIVQKLHDAFKKGMEEPEFQATLKKFYMPLLYLNLSHA